MTREDLIKAIYDNNEQWSCPSTDVCTATCMQCAEYLLDRYEDSVRANVSQYEVKKEYRQNLLNELVNRVELKVLGVHPDELCFNYSAYDVVKIVSDVVKEMQ